MSLKRPICPVNKHKSFATASDAQAVADRMKTREGFVPKDGETLRPYYCSECCFWHIGNSKRRVDEFQHDKRT